MRCLFPPPLAIAALLASPGLAQSPAVPPSLADGISAIADQGTHPDGTAAGIWAAGANYKVSFHDGMVFYPHVGPTLPHQPLRWRTRSVQVGGRELLDAATAPAPRCTATACDYDLGAVTERYELRQRGLEQLFVLDAPAGEGDLVIRGELTTPLQLPTAAAAQQALQFALADGRAVIAYGAAIAIDAAGRKAPVLTGCADGSITLRLDAAFVREASYPLVIDPLLSNTLFENGAAIDDCDILHETLTPLAQQARTWVVYSRTVAANDSDLWLKRLGTNFSGTPVEVHREISTWDATHGRIALCPASARTITVYQTGPHLDPLNLQTFVATHLHDVADVALRTSSASPFVAPTQWDARPDVGGRSDSASPNVLVVFQRDAGSNWSNTATSSVMAGILDTSVGTQGALVGSTFALRNHPNQDQERPCVNHAADGGAWLCAFQEHDGQVANDDWDITVLRVTAAGGVSTTDVTPAESGNPLLHKLAPRLAGAGGRFVLTYATQQFQLPNPKPQNERGERVRCQRIDWQPGTGGSLPHPSVLLASSATPDLSPEGIAFDSTNQSLWCAGVRDRVADTFAVHKLGFRGLVTETGVLGPFANVEPVALAVCFNDNQRDFPLAFCGNDTNGVGALYLSEMQYDAVAAPQTYGFACGSGTFGSTAVLAERQQVGSQAMPLELVNAPQDGLAFLLLSFGRVQFPLGGFGMPGCDLLVDPSSNAYLGLLIGGVTGGQSRIALDLIETLPPLTFYAQWAYPAPGANPAALLGSEGLMVQVGR